jgi:hypothetical protein
MSSKKTSIVSAIALSKGAQQLEQVKQSIHANKTPKRPKQPLCINDYSSMTTNQDREENETEHCDGNEEVCVTNTRKE